MRFGCIACLLAGVLATMACEKSVPATVAISREREDSGVRKKDGASGAVAVAWRGEMRYVAAYGTRDEDKSESTTADTRFRIASVSKPITATAINVLVDREKLTVDDKIWPHLGIVDEPKDPRFKDITVEP